MKINSNTDVSQPKTYIRMYYVTYGKQALRSLKNTYEEIRLEIRNFS